MKKLAVLALVMLTQALPAFADEVEVKQFGTGCPTGVQIEIRSAPTCVSFQSDFLPGVDPSSYVLGVNKMLADLRDAAPDRHFALQVIYTKGDKMNEIIGINLIEAGQ